MVIRFTPPVEQAYYRMVPFPLSSHFYASIDLGVAVWRIAGVWHSGTNPLNSDIEAADRYYPGGYVHELTEAQQTELVAGGFGAYITTEDL